MEAASRPDCAPQDPPLQIAAGTSVTRKIDLTPLFPVQDRGVYHVRAMFFSPT